MKIKSYILLIALFLAAQMLSLLHMTAHGFEKHEHDGLICEVYLLSEQTKNTDTANPIVWPTMVFTAIRPPIFTPVFLSQETFNGVSTRGPPVYLLS